MHLAPNSSDGEYNSGRQRSVQNTKFQLDQRDQAPSFAAMGSSLVLSLFMAQAVTATATLRGSQPPPGDRSLQLTPGGSLRIINGDDAPEDKYSFAVSLADSIGHFCGGSMIAPDTVLSAAHCAGGRYEVIVGRHHVNDRDGDVVGVKKELKHPNYRASTTNNDYMLLFLDRAIDADKVDVTYVTVSDRFLGKNEPATVVGWGDTHISDKVQDLAKELQEVEVYTMDNDDCDDSEGEIGGFKDNYHGQITDSMLCARHPEEKDACQGDSGGPLVIVNGDSFEQVGVVSWGVGCAHDDFPGVYARISHEYEWIKEEVCNRSKFKPSYLCGSGVNINTGGGSSSNASTSSVATPDPTREPTRPPTREPTRQPTRPPTSPPSNPPVNNPSPTPDPTRKPTPKPTFMKVDSAGVEVVGSKPTAAQFVTVGFTNASDNEEDRHWTNIESEDFHTSLGIFNQDAHIETDFLSQRKGRLGVVRIENDSTLTSGPISLLDGNTLVEVTLAAYVVVFEETDMFCLESSKDGKKWQQEKCWMVPAATQGNQNPVAPPGIEYVPNKVWTDLSAEFAWYQSSVRLRFSCFGDHKHDDVLIDRVDIRASSS